MLNFKLNRHLKLALCTCLMSFQQLIVGCSFVFSSIVLSKLKEPTSTIKINTEDSSWIASVPILVCPIGLLVIGILTDKLGRRKALQVGYIPLIVSWLVLAYANSLKLIMIGRIILGIGLGSGTCVYLYLAEVCPTQYRPLYFSVVTIFVGAGMMTECVLSMFFQWQTVSLILFVASTVNCAALFLVPETPMWLRTRGRSREADAAEAWLGMEPAAVTVPAAAPVTALAVNGDDHLCGADGHAATGKPTPVAYWTLFTGPSVWKPALITTLFFICQQGSGFYVMLFYSVDVLHDCRVQWDGITVTAFLSLSRVTGSVVYSMLHHVHRKTLVVVSGSGMALSLAIVIIYMRMYKDVASPPYGAVLIVAFIAYVFFALLAMLPLPWTICGEVFPMAVKGVMGGVVQFFGYEFMFLVIKVYPTFVSTFGPECVWSVFTIFCFASALYGAFIMPETKGKSLNEILSSFDSREKSIKNNLP
ncbi:facilitated trehalose transporter Tret1-like [Metopolophium dirhodum]|uniref:facilitated trehalose transporter Tret1-like n=1 Tax=Metopolophium dirhodum TaxID=44670 RepID=UPI00298F43EC|nr:facilitated trehalose transporter Tret1-like [Metopolophium dirhodum]